MASVNKVILLGNLGRDPEIRYTPDGMSVGRLSLATTRHWNDPNSKEKRSETEWHSIMLYGRLTEIAERYIKKGQSVYVEGRLRTRKWTDKNNIERYTTEVVADTLQMLGSRTDTADHPATQESATQQTTHQASAATTKPATQTSQQSQQVSNTANDFEDPLF